MEQELTKEEFYDLRKAHDDCQPDLLLAMRGGIISSREALARLQRHVPIGTARHFKSTPEKPMEYFVGKLAIIEGTVRVLYYSLYEDLDSERPTTFDMEFTRPLLSAPGAPEEDRDGFIDPVMRDGHYYRRFMLLKTYLVTEHHHVVMMRQNGFVAS